MLDALVLLQPHNVEDRVRSAALECLECCVHRLPSKTNRIQEVVIEGGHNRLDVRIHQVGLEAERHQLLLAHSSMLEVRAELALGLVHD